MTTISFKTKLASIIKWLLIMLTYGMLYPLAYIVYPLSYNTRKWTRRIRYSNKCWWYIVPLWVFLDDKEWQHSGRDYGESEPYWFAKQNPNLKTWFGRFRMAYLWGVTRNHAWNFHSLCGLKEEDEKKVVSFKGVITKKGIEIDNPFAMASLVYEDENGNWTGNKGEYLSYKYSTLGSLFTWYKIGKCLYWRFSFAKRIKWLGKWIEFQAGTNNVRYTLRFKVKNVRFNNNN